MHYLRELLKAFGVKHPDTFVYFGTLDENTDMEIRHSLVRIVNHTTKSSVIILKPSSGTGIYSFVNQMLDQIRHATEEGHGESLRFLTKDGFGAYRESPNDDIYDMLWIKNTTKDDLFNRYFSPSQLVIDTKASLVKRYQLDKPGTIGVYYRGTDSYLNRAVPEVDAFFAAIDKLPSEARLFVQTDSRPISELFRGRYKERVVVIHELPMSDGKLGVHHKKIVGRAGHTVIFDAALRILSECEHLVMSGRSNCTDYIRRLRGHKPSTYEIMGVEKS